MVKNTKSFWDVGIYAMGCCGAIGVIWLQKCSSSMFACFFSGLDD